MFHWYGFFIGLGILVVFWFPEKKFHEKTEDGEFQRSGVWVLVGALLGARLYHLFTDWQFYTTASFLEILGVWNGGLGIFGAIAGGFLGLVLYSMFKKKRLIQTLDLFAFGTPFAQSIARWGNVISGEFMTQGFLSFPILESLSMAVVGLFFWKKFSAQDVGTGNIVGWYGVAYGLVRFFLDFLRTDLPSHLGLTFSQYAALAFFILGSVQLLHEKNCAFFGNLVRFVLFRPLRNPTHQNSSK